MNLKLTLEDYTEAGFMAFLENSWAVSVSETQHHRLIMHFDAISGHPMDADTLLSGEQQGRHASPSVVPTGVRHHSVSRKS